MILYTFGDDKPESSLNFYSKILCRVSGLIVFIYENSGDQIECMHGTQQMHITVPLMN